MIRLLRLFACLVTAIAANAPATAEQQDVAAVVRGVVRVVIIATNGDDAYFVGHGSGFAVAPDKVLTNAHVVEMLKTEPNLVLGIIPSAGKKSFGGRVIAFSPGNDLALIQLREGSLPVATFFAGAVSDGQHVTAIGYPGSVDRAQGLDMNEMVRPLSPVKTTGTISTGRSSHGFDTLLHTAPIAQGNSGGPLVDDCGRVLGVNSFGSQAESEADAEFGFAVSNREVATFLRQAGVQFQRSSSPCRTIAELDAQEARLKEEEAERRARQEVAAAAASAKAREEARDRAEQDVYSSRENAMAIAAVLLVLSALSFGGAMMFHGQGRTKERKWALIVGGVLLAGAVVAFALRPSFSEIEDRIDTAGADNATQADPGADAQGDNLCRIVEARSRITVSDSSDVPLNWQAGGCVNGDTQYGGDGDNWSRVFVPETEAVVSINSFDPVGHAYKVERFLPDDAVMEQAREMRRRFAFEGCTADPQTLARLRQMQSEIRSLLPAQPNERLVYQCGPAGAAAIAPN